MGEMERVFGIEMDKSADTKPEVHLMPGREFDATCNRITEDGDICQGRMLIGNGESGCICAVVAAPCSLCEDGWLCCDRCGTVHCAQTGETIDG
jgi:hypothetical protein